MLTVQEESSLEKYMIDMADYGQPLNYKVATTEGGFVDTREAYPIH